MELNAKPSPKLLTAVLSVVLLCLISVLIYLWSVYGSRAHIFECTNYAMGTVIQQTVYGKNGEAAATAAAQRIGELEDLISWRREDSDIQKLNAHAGVDWLEIDEKTFSLLETCLEVAERSEGAFDPTILPISALWDFGGDNQHVPEPEKIEKFLPYVNYQNLRLNEEDVSASLKYHYMSVDLGAAGKGAACDEAIAAYQEAGADYGIIAVGGSVGLFGTKPGGDDWRIAVRAPVSGGDPSEAMGELSLTSGFVSTSGSYEKEFEENGVTYHHLLNPKTGYPENNGLVSVTVICEEGALSDILSTACFVLGEEKGRELLSSYDAEGIFIHSDGQVFVTEGLRDRFTITSADYVLEAGE